MKLLRILPSLLTLIALAAAPALRAADPQTVVYEGKEGPGKGKQIVFLAGDEEYRSEEGLPQLAKILAEKHGFKCTVLFSINKATGEIDPNTPDNTPGMEALDTADACVMLLRFREMPDAQMKHFVDYMNAGKPLVALRTSTHAFQYKNDPNSPYAKYGWQSKEWKGGFGKQILGETWVNHHGAHKKEATRGIIEPAAKENPILRGVSDLFWTTDVYEAHPPADTTVLVLGQVLTGMNPTDPPVVGPKNEPMQAIAWTREVKSESGKTNKILTMTMGAASDLVNEGLRRLIVNGVYWGLGLEIPAKADVALVGDYQPSFYGFKGFKTGVKPADLAK